MSDDTQNPEAGSEQQPQEQTNRSEMRIKDLSDKYAQEAEARKKADEEKANALREVEFYKGFTPLTSRYQSAGEFQDKIKEKVMAGYDIEDATISVLNREGKLIPQTENKSRVSPTGGSAVTTLRSSEKNLNEMNNKELREALMQRESETGDLSSLLNRII